MLRRCRSDLSHVIPVEEIDLNSDLSYDDEPVEILTSDSKVLRGRTTELAKVKWRHRGVEEATWERKDDMMDTSSNPSRETGEPISEVRTRNWKLQEGENRLSGLLEGISMIHGYEWYSEGMRDDAMRLACMRNGVMRLACMRNGAMRLACMRNDATILAWMRNDATMLAWMRNDAMRS
ncbi:hypothetical protein GQ457_10G006610 [Hibiscus cannabinus]